VTSTKRQKMQISRSIVDAVRSSGGRFLDKSPTTGFWADIGDRKAIEKTSQALRDGASGLRKELSEDLGDPEFLAGVFDANENLTDKDLPEKVRASSFCAESGSVNDQLMSIAYIYFFIHR
jgi:hypothetical protein